MKNFLLVICLFIVVSGSYAQQTEPSPVMTREDYLKKSKSQKTTGFILLGIGAACLGIAAPGDVSFDALPVLVIGGSVAVLSSIPLFIASGKKKRKAMNMSASIDLQAIQDLNKVEMSPKYYPAISFKLKF